MLLRLLARARAQGELPEAEVAVGDEGAHAARLGERQRLAVVAGSVLGAAGRRDVTGEAEDVSLACPSPQAPGERLPGPVRGIGRGGARPPPVESPPLSAP